MISQDSNKITIDQVAKYCGVSKTTISRYLNGRYDAMSKETQNRIRDAVEKLNYRPNRTAQRLKSSRTKLIGCVVSDISSPFSALLLRGIMQVCEEAGYQVLFADSRDSPKRECRAIEDFLQNSVDGLVINTTSGNDDYLLSIKDRGIPIVLADRELRQNNMIDTVTTPNFEDAYRCVQFLFECGYTEIAFFTEQLKGISPRVHRNSGYKTAMKELSPAGTEAHIYEINPKNVAESTEYVRTFRERFMGKRVAILAANGVVAHSVLLAMKALGIMAGYEFGFCTFDDWDWLQLSSPEVTAVSMGTEEIGIRAAELLLKRINADDEGAVQSSFLQLPTKLIVRGSTVRQK